MRAQFAEGRGCNSIGVGVGAGSSLRAGCGPISQYARSGPGVEVCEGGAHGAAVEAAAARGARMPAYGAL
jgi:hypothetical protein